VPHFAGKEEETASGILLPEDTRAKEGNRYIVATIIDVASDCHDTFKKFKKGTFTEDREMIIDSTMIEEIPYKGKSFYLILENYVVGLLRG